MNRNGRPLEQKKKNNDYTLSRRVGVFEARGSRHDLV